MFNVWPAVYQLFQPQHRFNATVSSATEFFTDRLNSHVLPDLPMSKSDKF